MGILDKFCRFCTGELDSRRRDIFEPENSHLLKAAVECIPLPMSAEDKFPNFTCDHCAHKLNDIAEFQSNGLSALNFFEVYLAENGSNSTAPVENWLQTEIKIELHEEIETDIVEEFIPKIEPRSENEDEEEECGHELKDLNSAPEQQCELKKCAVELSRCDELAPSIEIEPATERLNLPSGDDEQPSSEAKCIATFEGTRKDFHRCDHCERSFNYKSKLIEHLRVHTKEKSFKCEHCEKSFYLQGNLTSHIRVHSGEKPFKCQNCEKCFRHKSALVTHTRIHDGEKPYKCKHCTQSFRHKSSLVTHTRAHMGETPFKCEYCEKCFSRKSRLNTHTRAHMGETPFKCEYCEKGFSRKSRLDAHILMHTVGKPKKKF